MLLFVPVAILFSLGVSNNLTDILVQQFKKSFELSQFRPQLVQTANFPGYLHGHPRSTVDAAMGI
jgi:MFS transporter, FHS family, L-fucose permease